MKHKFLVIDDNSRDLEAIEYLLEAHGFHVKTTTDPEEGIAFVRQNRGGITLAIVDFNMPEMNGARVAEALRRLDPRLQIATYSGDCGTDVYEALSVGSQYFIQKGIDPDKFIAIIKMFCKRYEELHKTVAAEPITDAAVAKINALGIIGRSHHLVEVTHLAQTYAPQSETILITGENGTGKERIARAIHALSGRRGPFIPVNCGAIPSELLESELFGHEKGAFSGAVRDKVGLVQAANNGTIFLDEIGDLPLQLQVKLLRFLQESELRPVGSNETVKVNTRVVVATNVNLEEAVPAGRFRQDLYYRIKGFPIHLKPLRDRREDIKPLVLRFSQVVAAEKGINKEFLEETVKLLTRYDWPGNIRELEHEVKRAMMLAPGKSIAPADIQLSIREAVEKNERLGLIDSDIDYEAFRGQQRLRDEEEEKRFLLEKLKRAKSVREFARDVLKISNSTLQGRLKLLGIEFKTPTEKTEPKGKLEYETT